MDRNYSIFVPCFRRRISSLFHYHCRNLKLMMHMRLTSTLGDLLRRAAARLCCLGMGSDQRVRRSRDSAPTPANSTPNHWSRVSVAIERSVQSTRLVRELQVSAQAKVDVADYAMQRLMADLARVMPGLAVAAARPQTAVQAIEPTPIRMAA